MSKYGNNWDSWESMKTDFFYSGSAPEDFPTDDEIIEAWYDSPSYDGYCWLAYQRDGKIYEFSDSHCSCNGLEWRGGEETSIEAILMRPSDSYTGPTAEGRKKLEALKRQ